MYVLIDVSMYVLIDVSHFRCVRIKISTSNIVVVALMSAQSQIKFLPHGFSLYVEILYFFINISFCFWFITFIFCFKSVNPVQLGCLLCFFFTSHILHIKFVHRCPHCFIILTISILVRKFCYKIHLVHHLFLVCCGFFFGLSFFFKCNFVFAVEIFSTSCDLLHFF